MRELFMPPQHERGAALLTVLLLVAVMAVISATALDRLRLSSRLAANGAAMTQARAYNHAAEGIAKARIADLIKANPAQLTNSGGWLDRDIPIPIEYGSAVTRISDAQNCFNINSLVTGNERRFTANRNMSAQFLRLMTLIGIPAADAQVIADSAIDWADSDSNVTGSGAEDSHYAGLPRPYLAANRLFIDIGELHAVRGMTQAYLSRLRPWICALPIAEPVRLNANTLAPDRALLVSAILDGKIMPGEARTMLANRPASGYGSAVKFWAQPRMAAASIPADIQGQIGVTSNWFLLRNRIANESIELESVSLMDARSHPVKLVWRNWSVQQ